MEAFEAVAAEHDLAVEVHYQPLGAHRGWIVAIRGQDVFGFATGPTIRAAGNEAMAQTGLSSPSDPRTA